MRILSGIQPSGKLHLGNYFGYVQPNIELQAKADAGFIMIADLHALTSVQDAKLLHELVTEMTLDLIACGFDHKKTCIFRQSTVPEHTELMWLLLSVTPMGLLERAVSYKEKVEKGIPASAALFTYPVLQAADIMLYDVDTVPVGRDQKQHLEMTRDIAVKFNNTFGETLVVPEAKIRDEVAVVPGTDGQKMSKSYGNTIPLFAEESVVKKAIMGIVSDSKGMNDPKDPDTCVIYQIHKLLLSQSEAKILAEEYRNGLPYGEAKKKLLITYLDVFGPMRAARAKLKKEDAETFLQDSTAQARAYASKTIQKVKKAVGLI